MGTFTKKVLPKSMKFSFHVLAITGFLAFLIAPRLFGVVLLTPSLVALVCTYGIVALFFGLLYNGFKHRRG